MKKLTKIVLSLLILAAVVLPIAGNAASYKAAEAEGTTQGVITCANMYDWNFGSYQDVIAFISLDETQTMGTLTGQQDPAVFGWFCSALLELDEAKGVWVVKEAYTSPDGVANPFHNTTLGEGKMVIMYHANLAGAKQADYDFYNTNLVVGKEFYLGVHPSAMYDVYDYVDGAFLSTVPVEVDEPEPETEATDDADKDDANKDDANADADKDADKDAEGGINPLVIAVVVVVIIAVVGVIVVVSKKKKA